MLGEVQLPRHAKKRHGCGARFGRHTQIAPQLGLLPPPVRAAQVFFQQGSHLLLRGIRIKTKFSVMSFLRLLPQRLPRIFRQVEQDVETVIHVLQPGPIGIVEHKFTDVEILEARATVKRAVDNWQRNWTLERNLGSASFDKWKK
ncbi:uncharacterized protein LOC112887601 [Panicum hallii]|nr:uncharacterized protein LOC112887601 [Panicum hallii]